LRCVALLTLFRSALQWGEFNPDAEDGGYFDEGSSPTKKGRFSTGSVEVVRGADDDIVGGARRTSGQFGKDASFGDDGFGDMGDDAMLPDDMDDFQGNDAVMNTSDDLLAGAGVDDIDGLDAAAKRTSTKRKRKVVIDNDNTELSRWERDATRQDGRSACPTRSPTALLRPARPSSQVFPHLPFPSVLSHSSCSPLLRSEAIKASLDDTSKITGPVFDPRAPYTAAADAALSFEEQILRPACADHANPALIAAWDATLGGKGFRKRRDVRVKERMQAQEEEEEVEIQRAAADVSARNDEVFDMAGDDNQFMGNDDYEDDNMQVSARTRARL